jgi:hypothetical protein
MAASVYSRTLQKAADLLGGRTKLARTLRVPTKDLDAWIADEAKPPLNVFLRVVDLIIDEPGAAASSSGEPGDSQPPRDAAGRSRAHYED